MELTVEQQFKLAQLSLEVKQLTRAELEAAVVAILKVQFAKDNFWIAQLSQKI